MRHIFIWVLGLMLLFSSCRKSIMDYETTDSNQLVDVNRFFAVSNNANPLVVSIINDIKKKNAGSDFLKSFIKENGYPSWDHVIVSEDYATGVNTIVQRSSETNTGNSGRVPFVIIPMTEKNSKRVISYTQCYLFNDSTVKYITTRKKDLLRKYPESIYQKINRQISFTLFAVFEKRINPSQRFILPAPYNQDYSKANFGRVSGLPQEANSISVSSQHIEVSTGTPNNHDIYYVDNGDYRIYYIYHADGPNPKWTILSITMISQVPQNDPGGGDLPPNYYPIFYPDPLPGYNQYADNISGGGSGGGSMINFPPGWFSQDPNGPAFAPDVNNFQEPGDTDYIPNSLSGNSAWNYIAIGLVNNSFGLIDFTNIPCPSKEAWLQLAAFKPNQSAIDKLNTISATIYSSNGSSSMSGYIEHKYVAAIQYLSSGFSATTNLDYFPIKINTLPTVNGQQLSPNGFLNYIRTHLNQFVDTTISKFTPYNHYGVNDNALWNSSNPSDAIVSLDIFGNDGSVITSFDPANPSKWIFSTIKDPYNGQHPVSGNREFSIEPDPSGGYILFTRGVDRLSDPIGTILQFTFGVPFNTATDLWQSFQARVNTFVNQHGGNATVESPVIARPNWDLLRAVMNRTMPLSSIPFKSPCN